MSVAADGENKNRTRAFQTDSGGTIKAPLSDGDALRPNHDEVHAMTAMKLFRRKQIAVKFAEPRCT